MVAARHFNQLNRHTQAIVGLADAALEQRLHVELCANGPDVLAFAAELKGRGARGHAQAIDVRERVDELLGQALTEVFLVVTRTHVRERQHSDRGDGSGSRRRRGRRRGVFSGHRGDELISPAVASLDELRVFRIVAEDAAQLLDARREGIVGHRDVRPQRTQTSRLSTPGNRHWRRGSSARPRPWASGALPARGTRAGPCRAGSGIRRSRRSGSWSGRPQYISGPARAGGLMRQPAA